MKWEERIVLDPAILAGKPIIKGTRLAVEFIIDLLAQGWSEHQIFENYPGGHTRGRSGLPWIRQQRPSF